MDVITDRLQAKNKDGALETLICLDQRTIEKQKKIQTYFCPVCNEQVIIRAGTSKIAHFAHLPNNSCPVSREGEGIYHEIGKLHLFQWLKKQHIRTQLEYYIPKIKQRADLFLTIGHKQIAIEFQCATISAKEIIKRTIGYQQVNIIPIWILGGNRMKRVDTNTLLLSSSDYLYIHKYSKISPLFMYYYCPDTNQFSIFQHILLTGKKKTFGNLQFRRLGDILLTDLWKEESTVNNLMDQWLANKIRFRTIMSPHISSAEKEWRQSLYLMRLQPSLLPSIVNLPVPGQYQMRCAPWIWQSKICFELLIPDRVVTRNMCYQLLRPFEFNQNHFPLIRCPDDPIIDYLYLLTKLDYLKQISPTSFRVIKQVVYPNHIEDAIEQDKKLFINLKTCK